MITVSTSWPYSHLLPPLDPSVLTQPMDSMLGTARESYSSPFGLEWVFSPHSLGFAGSAFSPVQESLELVVEHPRPSCASASLGAVLRGKFIATQAFLNREEKSQIENWTHHLNELDKEEQTKPKVSRRKDIIKIKEEINKVEIQKTIEKKINKTKSWFFEKVNKIDKPLARLTKKRREITQINKIISEKGKITMDTAEIQKKKNHKRILWITICQQIWQSRRNG